MKKLIGTVAVAALLATAAFAELNMGAWVRTVVAPVAYNGDKILTGWENSWGWGIRNARISFNFASEDGKIGMQYDVFGDGSSGFGSGDYRAAWYKPADWVKFMVGHIDNSYAMRGDLCYGSWNWLRPANWYEGDEGLTFNLGNRDGLQIEFFPVEGLQILAHLSLPADGGFGEFKDQIKNSLVGLAYTIGDIGTIKVGYVGGYSEAGDTKKNILKTGVKKEDAREKGYYKKNNDGGWDKLDGTDLVEALIDGSAVKYDGDYIEVVDTQHGKTLGNAQIGFDLIGVENLFLTIGARVNLADKYYAGNEISKIAAGFSYQITDSFKLSASLGAFLRKEIAPGMQAGVGIDIGLTDTLGLAADVRWQGDLEAKDHYISFLVGLGWGFSSNGSIGIGFQATTGGLGFNGEGAITAAKSDAFCFAVPVTFSYWF